jgi:hypothetical protein
LRPQELQQYVVKAIGLVEADCVSTVFDDHRAAERIGGDRGLSMLAWPNLGIPASDHQHWSCDPLDDVSPVLQSRIIE